MLHLSDALCRNQGVHVPKTPLAQHVGDCVEFLHAANRGPRIDSVTGLLHCLFPYMGLVNFVCLDIFRDECEWDSLEPSAICIEQKRKGVTSAVALILLLQ